MDAGQTSQLLHDVFHASAQDEKDVALMLIPVIWCLRFIETNCCFGLSIGRKMQGVEAPSMTIESIYFSPGPRSTFSSCSLFLLEMFLHTALWKSLLVAWMNPGSVESLAFSRKAKQLQLKQKFGGNEKETPSLRERKTGTLEHTF